MRQYIIDQFASECIIHLMEFVQEPNYLSISSNKGNEKHVQTIPWATNLLNSIFLTLAQ
jgi:hypothetical protein